MEKSMERALKKRLIQTFRKEAKKVLPPPEEILNDITAHLQRFEPDKLYEYTAPRARDISQRAEEINQKGRIKLRGEIKNEEELRKYLEEQQVTQHKKKTIDRAAWLFATKQKVGTKNLVSDFWKFVREQYNPETVKRLESRKDEVERIFIWNVRHAKDLLEHEKYRKRQEEWEEKKIKELNNLPLDYRERYKRFIKGRIPIHYLKKLRHKYPKLAKLLEKISYEEKYLD